MISETTKSWTDKDGYRLDYTGSRITVTSHGKSKSIRLTEPIYPIASKMLADALCKAGVDPADYCEVDYEPIRKAAMDWIVQCYEDANKEPVPGYDVLTQAYRRLDEDNYRCSTAMDNGGQWPADPKVKIAELKQAYPQAAAYIKAERFADASHDRKVEIGKQAMDAIRQDEDDYDTILQRMETEWSDAARKSVWN